VTIYKHYIALIILLVTTVFFCVSQLPIVENIWEFSFDDGTYSHAYLIPFICVYLFWSLFKNNELTFNQEFNYKAFGVLFFVGLALSFVTLAQFTSGYRVLFIAFYASLISVIFKPNIKVLFSALFFIFLVPVWGVLITPLQNLSTTAVTFIMGFTGIPLFVERNLITIPAGVFEIAGGCSGLRYLLVSLSISSLYIFLNIRSYKNGFIFLLLAILGALITNWLRITGLILIGHFTEMTSPLMEDHNSFGWYLYVPFIMVLFYFGNKYLADEPKQSQKTINVQEPNFKILIVALSALILFSPFTVSKMAQKKKEELKCNQRIENLPVPKLYGNYDYCSDEKENIVKIKYTYSGRSLGDTVNYFQNEYFPEGYKLINKEVNDNFIELTISKLNSNYIIRYHFLSGDIATSNIVELKKLKLKNALKGIRDSSLVWEIIPKG